MSLYDTIAGGFDHLAGSTDEALARSFDDTEGGGLWDGATGVTDHLAGSTDEAVGRATDAASSGDWAGFLDHLAGDVDEAASRGPVDTTIDVLWSGHDGDTIDVFGPTLFGEEGSAADVVVNEEGESTEGEMGTKLFLVGLAVVVFLIIAAPLLNVIAGVVE